MYYALLNVLFQFLSLSLSLFLFLFFSLAKVAYIVYVAGSMATVRSTDPGPMETVNQKMACQGKRSCQSKVIRQRWHKKRERSRRKPSSKRALRRWGLFLILFFSVPTWLEKNSPNTSYYIYLLNRRDTKIRMFFLFPFPKIESQSRQ